jgi:hypothetical protein
LAQWLVMGLIEHSTSHQLLWCIDSFVLRNPPLRQAPNRYDIDEALPWFSTISRTRQLYGEEVFLALFKKVLSKCVEKDIVRGKRQAVDSAFIKATASMDSLVEKEVIENDVEDYAKELNDKSDEKNDLSNTKNDKAKKTITSERKKHVEQHHAWKAKEYKDQPSNKNSKQVDEHGNLIRPIFGGAYTSIYRTSIVFKLLPIS